MPKSKGKSSNNDDIKRRDLLQAIVIVDNLDSRFGPLVHDDARVLLPLANVPLLHFVMLNLKNSDIEEVLLFCLSGIKQILIFLRENGWLNLKKMRVTVQASEHCLSFGDAIREIDQLGWIQAEFLLMHGDTVSNVNFKAAIENHRELHKKVKSAVMTMLMQSVSPLHPRRHRNENSYFVLDSSDNKLLQYSKSRLPLSPSSSKSLSQTDCRTDLMDTQVSVCSPLVLAQFSDNFDYQTQDDFVRGILVDEEILGSTVHLHRLEHEYACRASNLHLYDIVSQDVLCRWSYPCVPDSMMLRSVVGKYNYGHRNIYIHQAAAVARKASLGCNVIIGESTTIGDGTAISHSVIGNHCIIGKNVKIEKSYLWDGVVVADGCSISGSVIGHRAKIKGHVNIEPQCVIGQKVVIGPSVSIASGSAVSSVLPRDGNVDHVKFGNEARACDFHEEFPAGVDDVDGGSAGSLWALGFDSDVEVDSSEGDEVDGSRGAGCHEEMEDDQLFYLEVIKTLERGLDENIKTENIVLEINSLKHAYNIQIADVNFLLSKAVAEYPLLRHCRSVDKLAYFKQIMKNSSCFFPVLGNYMKKKNSQLDCLAALQELAFSSATFCDVLAKYVELLYDGDVLTEEAILEWHGDDLPIPIATLMEPLIKWLKEAPEESDGDS